MLSSARDYAHEGRIRHLTRTGRAWVIPVMWGTFERQVSPEKRGRTSDLERTIMRFKDFRRTIDYLETRPDIDADRVAYEGLSWGGWVGGVLPAIEERLKVAVLFGGGLNSELPPEYSQFNFAPRVRVPVLMQNGRHDFMFPIETSVKPLLRLLGTPEKDKELKIYETGHSVWLTNELFRDEVAFLDKHLGPTTSP
jgi:dienelactone hydrolase